MNSSDERRQLDREPHLGGVSVIPARDRLGDGEEAFAVLWRAPSRIWPGCPPSAEDVAGAAGRVLAAFVGAVVRRRSTVRPRGGTSKVYGLSLPDRWCPFIRNHAAPVQKLGFYQEL